MKAPLLLALLILACPLPAQDLYCLGRISLAGMPPEASPLQGESLFLETGTQRLLRSDGTPVGHIPAVYGQAIHTMQARGVNLRFEVVFQYPTPAPGRFLMVEVWAVPENPSDLESLVYRIPHHQNPSEERW